MAARLLVVVFAVLAMTSAPAARAMDWVSDRDIAAYCSKFLVRPETPSGTVCLSYIQGFLDGLRTTEVPARHELEFHVDDVRTKDAMHESAVRMDALVEEYGPAARAGVCLPKEFSEEEIVRVIARELRHGSSYTRAALDDYAQAALQERYPCDISAPGPAPGPAPEPESNDREGALINAPGEQDEARKDETRNDSRRIETENGEDSGKGREGDQEDVQDEGIETEL